jgi:hypothetical protein
MTTLTKIITMSSSNCERLNGEFISNVRFGFSHVLAAANHIHYNTVSIQSAEIPHSFYNVDEIHNAIYYTLQDTGEFGTFYNNYTMTISEGQYNANTFITAFQTQFAAGGHGKTCVMTLDKISGKFLLSPSDSTFTIKIYTDGTSAFRIIGLDTASDHTFSYSATGTSFTYPCNFLGITKLKVFSDALACDNLDSSALGETNLIDSITVNAPAYGLIKFNASQHNECIMKHRKIDNIDVQIRDERNNYVDFNNQDWSITFTINSVTDEDFKPTKEFGALLSLQQRAQMIAKLKEDHKDARVMPKLKEADEEYEEDISELSDDDLELILEVPDKRIEK